MPPSLTIKNTSNLKSYSLPKSVGIVFLLLSLGGVSWLSFNLGNKHNQIQQFLSADKLFAQQRYQEAISAYNKLLEAESGEPNNRDLVWINQGYAFSGLNQYQEMLKSCSNATLTSPNNGVGWNCRGEALYYLEQYQKALLAFNRALKLNPREVTFLLNRSRVLSDLLQYEQAISTSEQAINLGRNLPTNNQINQLNLAIAYGQKGKNLLKTKQYRLAVKAFESSLAYKPKNIVIQQQKGIALYQLGHYEQAIEIFTQVLKQDNLTTDQKVLSLIYQGISLCAMQELKKANHAFSQVLKLTSGAESTKMAKAGCGIR